MISPRIQLLVLGVGNPNCGDDAAGPAVVEKLTRLQPEGVRAQAVNAEPASIISAMKGNLRVVLVDAIQSRGATGALHIFDVSKAPLPADLFAHFSTHSFGLVDAIELARALGELPPKLYVLGIEGESFDPGDALSPRVANAIDDAIAWILERHKSRAFSRMR